MMLSTLAAVLIMWAFHKTLQYDELERRAYRVAAALESADDRYPSGVELLAFTKSFGAKTANLSDVALVDPEERIVASTRDEWRGAVINDIEVLRASRLADVWVLDEYRHVYLLPVQIENESLNSLYGDRLSALIVIDAKDLVVIVREIIVWVFAVVVFASLVFLAGCFYLLRKKVVGPVTRIYEALKEAKGKGRAPKMPYLYPDEIGEIAQVLMDLFKQISDADTDVRVMNRAIEGGSNEVFVINAETLKIERANKAARDNLAYSATELRGMHIDSIAPANSDPDLNAFHLRQLEESGEIQYCYDHVRSDGSTYPFQYKAILVEGKTHPVFIVIGEDVSDRMAQEAALQHSEERLQLALKGSNDGLFDLDVQAGTLFVSELIQSWFGFSGQIVTVEELLARIAPEYAETVETALHAAIHDDKDFNVEFQLVGRGGRWLQARGQVQFDEGAAARLTGFASDVTRRKVAENLLQTTVSRLSAVLDTIADGVLILDDDGRVRGVNPAALSMFGMDKDQLSDYLLSDCLSVVTGDGEFCAPDWSEISDGKLRECVGLRGDASQFAAEIAAMRMDAVADEHYTVLVRDISDRKQHEEELREAMEEAQAATQAKGEFLATMSHEIRTPMNGVLGMTQLLLDMDLNAQQRETAEIIFSSGEALLTLINDILDFSKIEAGKLELEQMPFDMRTAIKEVMDLLSSTARRKALDLYVDYEADLPYAFTGDIGRIRQILLNLVGNAVKFTAEGHVVVSVTTEAEEEGVLVQVSVRDTGPGINAQAQETLFDSFTQADASTTRRFGGTGLGLAICRQLVALMGGEIGVTSEPGGGAEFWFTLRLQQTEAMPEHEVRDFDKLKGLRLLAVDDNPVGLRIIEGMAASLGLEVTATHDPLAVVGLMSAAHEAGAPYDVIALDYNMPRMDGLTLATSIADDSRFVETRLVMLTSSELRRPGGLHGYALKPLMRDGLGRMLLSACFGAADNERSSTLLDEVLQVGNNVRVLVAEDNPVNQRVAVRMLERLGCRVDVAANGREAVEMWDQFPYAMIFMDCQMPELDGLAATEEIRAREAREARSRTPIVAMTANAMREDEDNCRAAGMDDYASKPVKLDLLQALVVRWSVRSDETPESLH